MTRGSPEATPAPTRSARTLAPFGPALAVAAAVAVGAAVAIGGLALLDRWEADPDDGRPLHVDVLGEGGPTLAFLPGHGLTTRYFGPRVAPLAADARLVLVDLLGFGRSPKPWVEYTVDRHVAELPREVLDDVRRHHWKSDTSTLWESVYRDDLPRDVARLRTGLPVLCLHGGADRTAPLDGVRRFAAARPNTRLHVLAGADHHPLLRDPAWCLAAIRERIRESGVMSSAAP